MACCSVPGMKKIVKTALITGATSGIGYEMAKILSLKGYSLWLTGRNLQAINKLEKEFPSCKTLSADLSEDQGRENFWTWIRDTPVDLMINNAGYGIWKEVVSSEKGELEKMIRVNVEVLLHFSSEFAKRMVKRGSGKILNVASIASFFPGPHMAAYYASKAFVLSFSEALNHELRKTNVSVTTLCPGPTKSKFFERAGINNSPLMNGSWIPHMTSYMVAKKGIEGALRGKRRVVPGLINYCLTTSSLFAPRRYQLSIINYIQDSRKI
ncbi:MAG: putative oxidoreductase [Owenweeksia sp. TMED14]|nr:MAG: putative oxidoreductase [Owenweeksia sp. TMED14]